MLELLDTKPTKQITSDDAYQVHTPQWFSGLGRQRTLGSC